MVIKWPNSVELCVPKGREELGCGFPLKPFKAHYIHYPETSQCYRLLYAGGTETLNSHSLWYPSYQRLVQAMQMGSFVLSLIPMNIFKRQSECDHYEQSKPNSTNVRSQYFLRVTQGKTQSQFRW